MDINTIPKDKSKVPTHELLQKLGFVKQPAAGLVHWLPNGLRTLSKIESIIRQRMNEIDFEEVSLSSLSGSSLWERTGRWNNNELFKLQDSKKAQMCLVATCEEEITDIVNKSVKSYKQLPILVYQITRKYRDEKRPRSGLLRGREFLMKDGYSFDVSPEAALKTYNSVNEAYRNIFKDLKVPFVAANADSGSIGGNLSLEWHYKHHSGEDTLMECDHCGTIGNVEKAVSFPTDDAAPAQKADVKYFLTNDKNTLIAMYYPSDRALAPGFVKDEISDIDLESGSLANDQVLEVFKQEKPVEVDNDVELAVKSIIRVIDPRVTSASELPDFPAGVSFQRNSFTSFNDISIVEAQEGELCGSCEKGHLKSSNAIEVGHTFYLGKRYSEPLQATFKDKQSNDQLFEMGCYGIGVSRILAAIAEVLRDGKGLAWPASIAPYHLTLLNAKNFPMDGEEEASTTSTNANANDAQVKELVSQLRANQIELQKDFRQDVPLSFRIRESQIIGVPLVLILGKSFPRIEVEVRSRPFPKTSSEPLLWEKLYKTNKDKWEWEYKVDDKGNEKHFVHIDGIVEVTKALLKDL